MAAIASPSILSTSSSRGRDTFRIYTHPPQQKHRKRIRKASRDTHRAELPEEGIWTHIDSFFAESMDLTSESVDGGLFSPKINGADSMGGAEDAESAAGTSHPSSGKS